MLFCHIGILDQNFDYQPDVYVGIRGKRIAYIGETEPEGDYGERYNGMGKLLMPGLVNAHTHTPMTLLRGYAENLTLSQWLNTRVFPFEAKMQSEDIYRGALLAHAEMLRVGVASCTDMYYQGSALVRAMRESGIKGNLSLAVTCFDGRNYSDLPLCAENEALIQEHHGENDGRIQVDLCLHAEYTSTPKVARQVAEAAARKNLRVHLHLAETKDETEACRERHGVSPARYLADQGLFDQPCTAAHGIWLEDEDRAILKDKGVTVACCPVSNLKLASGFCNVPELLKAGIPVALGTDGAASNNNLNIWEEMKLFGTLYKAAFQDPTAVTPKQALYAATRAGALSQGRMDCGLVQEGFRADLIVLDLSAPWMHPVHQMLHNAAYSAQGSDVVLTMVDGEVLYRDGQFPKLDLKRIFAGAERSVKSILWRME